MQYYWVRKKKYCYLQQCRWSQTLLSDFAFTFHFHTLEKEMAAHFRVLAWRIPGMGEPGELLSMGSHRVGHDWSNLAAAAADGPRDYHTEWSKSEKDKFNMVLEKKMATHSSTLALRIPWTEEPGVLQSLGSQRVGHAWETLTHTHDMVSLTSLKWY